MKNTNNQFDKELHDRLHNEELPFDPLAWEIMEERLDREPNRFLFWLSSYKYLIGSLSILILAALIYWPYHYNGSKENVNSEVVSREDNKSDKIADHKTISELHTESNDQNSELITQKTTEVKESTFLKKSNQKTSNAINNSIPNAASNSTKRKSGINNTIKTYSIAGVSPNDAVIASKENKLNLENIKLSGNTLPTSNSSKEVSKTISNNTSLNVLLAIENIISAPLDYQRDLNPEMNIVEIKEKIIRPKHQINITAGAGMTKIDIDDPTVGTIKPTAVTNQEMFLSLSYLKRVKRNWGIEVGAQAAIQFQKIAHYFIAGEFEFTESEYARTSVNAYEGKYELFTNVHFFLPLNQRSELDIYGGFYALNPFSAQESFGGGSGDPSIFNNDLTLIRTSVNGERGIFNGGRIKIGLNYNFLTNKLNNIGVGIAYMQQVNNITEGNYRLLQSTEEALVVGNLRANPSGFKVQLTYGFGQKKLPWREEKLRM